MILWLKFIHVSAIAIWSAGLISLPMLLARRRANMDDDRRLRLQALVRFTYVAVTSPAAFLAVASGTALVFARQTFVVWFSVKLALVAGLVLLHALTGLVIIRLFREGERYGLARSIAATGITVSLIGAIVALVLAKPGLSFASLPDVSLEPGALRRMAEDLNLWPIP